MTRVAETGVNFFLASFTMVTRRAVAFEVPEAKCCTDAVVLTRVSETNVTFSLYIRIGITCSIDHRETLNIFTISIIRAMYFGPFDIELLNVQLTGIKFDLAYFCVIYRHKTFIYYFVNLSVA